MPTEENLVGETDILLHISIMPGRVVLNSFENGLWGNEQDLNLSIESDEEFEFEIRATEQEIEIYFNGEYKDNFHNQLLPLDEGRFVVIYGKEVVLDDWSIEIRSLA